MKIPCCDICNIAFNEDAHCPRIIKACGHTVCQSCLQLVIARAESAQITLVQCTLCKLEFSLQKYAINEFPKNFAILESIMVVNEESPCHHSSVAPQEFICLESRCVNNNKFCGLCYYTVHAKCDKKLVFKIRDYESKVKIEPFLIQPEEFTQESLKTIELWSAGEGKVAAGKLTETLGVFLTKTCVNPSIPELNELIDQRKRYYIHFDSETQAIFLQPKQRQLVNDFELEFRNLINAGKEKEVTEYDLLCSLRSLYLLYDQSQEAKSLCELLIGHAEIMKKANFKFEENTLQKSDFLTHCFGDFKGQFERTGVLDSMRKTSQVTEALLKKIENDIEHAKREISTLNQKFQTAREDRRKKYRDSIIEVKGKVFFKWSEIRRILDLFGSDLRIEAEALLDNCVNWKVNATEAKLIQDELKDVDLTKILAEHPDKHLISKECSLGFVEEDKNKFTTASEDQTAYETKISEIVPLHMQCIGNKSFGWKNTLKLLKTTNPDIETKIDPLFSYERSAVAEFFTRTGLLSKHADDKTVHTAFSTDKKQFEFPGDKFTEFLSLVAKQSESLKAAAKDLEFKKVLLEDLQKEQKDLQTRVQSSLEIEMLFSKVFKRKEEISN